MSCSILGHYVVIEWLFLTVIGISAAIWSEGTHHTCVTGHDLFFLLMYYFCIKLKSIINHYLYFLWKIFVFQVKCVFFPKLIHVCGYFTWDLKAVEDASSKKEKVVSRVFSVYNLKDVMVLQRDKKTAALKFIDLKCTFLFKQQVHWTRHVDDSIHVSLYLALTLTAL